MQGLRHMWRAHRAGYHGSIDPVSSAQDILKQWGARVHAAWFSAWRVLLVGAQIVLLAWLPSSHHKGRTTPSKPHRQSLAAHSCTETQI
jgi:hypothetical protein